MSFLSRIRSFLELIKFEHSLFALPFAYLGLFIASSGFPSFKTFLFVTLAMVAVRTAAMCLNRLIDAPIDVENPRTHSRIRLIEHVTRRGVWAITVISAVVFVLTAAWLNSLCLKLAPVPLLLIILYPFLKKITWSSHFVLGIILGIAPMGGWLAVRPEWSWLPFILMIAVTVWVSGFDMFYALQDVSFDQFKGLKSFPVKFGIERTIWVVSFLHGVSVFSLFLFGLMASLGIWYWASWVAVILLIFKEHWLIHQHGTGKIDLAFFNMNAYVSVVIFAGTLADLIF